MNASPTIHRVRNDSISKAVLLCFLEEYAVQDFENDAIQCTHFQSDLALQMVLHLNSVECARCKHLQAWLSPEEDLPSS